jgi:hypothetical protein
MDGHPADATKAQFVGPRRPSEVGAYYEPHTRQVWPGGGKVQEYDSTTFSNNMGFIDRDRFFDNPDSCVRVVHLGGSDVVALQVRPFEKTNIEMESELSVLLQRCVEVISAGRDNGDIGSNYPRVRDYAIKFKPDAILISNLNALVMQLQPQLLKLAIGWDHESNALDNFYYDAKGRLTFRPWAKDYPLYTIQPDFRPLTDGVALFQTLQVPFQYMHPLGKEAFRYLGDIMRYFIQHHPDQRFILHTGIDEAQCHGYCNSPVKLKNGVTAPMGAATFVANHGDFCKRNGFNCIHPQHAESYDTEATYLTFINDGHYSVRGHQWLARELAPALVSILRPN